MRKIIVAVLIIFGGVEVAQAGSTYVDGHLRRDGTYVPGHYRSNPDSSRFNNWSTQGNYNPYTGKRGTVDPYAPSNTYDYSNSLNRWRR